MNIKEWWPKLGSETQQWLIANNGDVVQQKFQAEIFAAGRQVSSQSDAGDGCLTDQEIDWIEATANGERNDV